MNSFSLNSSKYNKYYCTMCLALSCLPSSLPLQKKKIEPKRKKKFTKPHKKKKRNKTKKNNPIVFLVLCNYIAGVFFFVFQECVVISPQLQHYISINTYIYICKSKCKNTNTKKQRHRLTIISSPFYYFFLSLFADLYV